MVRMSRKEAIVSGLSTKEAKVDDIPVDNEEKPRGRWDNNQGLK